MNIFHLVLVTDMACAAYNIARLEKNMCVQKYSLGTMLIPPESLEHIRHARAHNKDMIEYCVLLSL